MQLNLILIVTQFTIVGILLLLLRLLPHEVFPLSAQLGPV